MNRENLWEKVMKSALEDRMMVLAYGLGKNDQ